MACRVSEWFSGLEQADRKILISTMFALRKYVDKNGADKLFQEFLEIFDDEYHSLKCTNCTRCNTCAPPPETKKD